MHLLLDYNLKLHILCIWYEKICKNPVDMFSIMAHVEMVSLIVKKNKSYFIKHAIFCARFLLCAQHGCN